MLKDTARRTLVKMGEWSNRLRPSRRVVGLCYHSVHPNKSLASATPQLFEEHLRWLSEHCECVSFSNILAKRLPESNRPIVSVTFDDGYADNHEHALPLLKKWSVPATFFVTVGLLEQDDATVQRLMQLRQTGFDEIRPLSWQQVEELLQEGMEIGSHTYSHPNLARLDPPNLQLELRRPKERLEERLGSEIMTMAYPFGKPGRHVNELVMEMVEEAGYEKAAAILFRGVRESDSRFVLPRFFATRNSLKTLKAKVEGDWDLMGRVQEKAPLWVARAVSPIDFDF